MIATLLLVPLLLAPFSDESLLRTEVSNKELEKIGQDVNEFFEALALDDRKEQQDSLEKVQTALGKLAKKQKVPDMLMYLGDIDVLLETSKPEDRAIKANAGKGFFVHAFHDEWDDKNVMSLLSLPKEYSRSEEFFPVIVGLKPQLGLAGEELEESLEAMADAMYADVLDTHIILIPIGVQVTEERDEVTQELDGSWLTDDGMYTFFMAFRTLLEKVRFDRSRLVLDAWGEAGLDGMRLASSAPSFFAGVVNRSGEASAPDLLLGNLTMIPVLYFQGLDDGADGDLGALEAAEIDLALITESGSAMAPGVEGQAQFVEWLGARRRELAPKEIIFKTGDLRFGSVNWCQASVINRRATAKPGDADFPYMHARVDPGANTIDIDTVNVLELRVFLSDAIVDLDQPVTIRVNGEQAVKKAFGRDLRYLLENRFYNNSGDYGLYCTSYLVEDIDPNLSN